MLPLIVLPLKTPTRHEDFSDAWRGGGGHGGLRSILLRGKGLGGLEELVEVWLNCQSAAPQNSSCACHEAGRCWRHNSCSKMSANWLELRSVFATESASNNTLTTPLKYKKSTCKKRQKPRQQNPVGFFSPKNAAKTLRKVLPISVLQFPSKVSTRNFANDPPRQGKTKGQQRKGKIVS